MYATRDRSISDSLSVAVLLVGMLVVSMLLIREVRVVPRVFSGAVSAVPASLSAISLVPPDAVSVPTLLISADREIQVGDSAADAVASLANIASVTAEVSDRGPLGPRTVRSYRSATTRFTVVCEPFERNGDQRVAAIYLR